MSMLEKFNEHKKTMHARLEEINESHAKMLDEVGNDFVNGFKSLVANASEEEFFEFICKSGDELDEIDRVAAITMRMESKREKRETCNCEKDKEHDGPGIAVFVLG